MTVRERVQTIFQDVFQDPALVLRDDMNSSNLENWDSLNHVSLIVGLESEFRVRFTTEEMTLLADVGDLFELLKRRGVSDG